MIQLISERIEESILTKQLILDNEGIKETIYEIAKEIKKSFSNNGKIILCGNGGSATDALHFAGEIVGRFQKEREPWPAIVLNSNVASMTAIANDYEYDEIYKRQAIAFTQKQDVFFGISTSGNSTSVIKAMEAAKEKGTKTVALTGKDGGRLSQIADFSIVVPSSNTARIQESHIMIIHIICEIVEDEMSKNE